MKRRLNTAAKNQRALTACAVFVPMSLWLAALTPPMAGQMLTTLYSFSYYDKDGFQPDAALLQGTDGYLYGTTATGGDSDRGTVFRISTAGEFTSLHSFNDNQGFGVYSGLVQGKDENFYGTTFLGGTNGDGTVFKMTPSGALTTLYNFNGADGDGVTSTLVQTSNGNFYGTTDDLGPGGAGVVFEINPSGIPTTLHGFDGADGSVPFYGVIQGADENFYGSTEFGGQNGSGTIFKISFAGTLTTLYNFCAQSGCSDGSLPQGLVQASDGNLYGTTGEGGAAGSGTVFKINLSGVLTTLHSFDAFGGAYPQCALIQGTDGNFYGTTFGGGRGFSGGLTGYGTIFTITPTGDFTVLHAFDSVDGEYPGAGLVQDTNGLFYGTTENGDHASGTVFSLSVGLAPFVKTLPVAGEIGTMVKILGTDLTGTTSVRFAGTPAAFSVVSSSEIAVEVPVGATSGKVVVTTPSGALVSNVSFRVLPL